MKNEIKSFKNDDINIENFLIEYPLYKKLDITSIHPLQIVELVKFEGPLDLFCNECKENRTFKKERTVRKGSSQIDFVDISPIEEVYNYEYFDEVTNVGYQGTCTFKSDKELKPPYHYKDKNYELKFECTWNKEHIAIFVLMVISNKIFKIGQHPSIYDLQSQILKKYETVLDDIYLKEFRTAIILNSFNFNIGAFTYLRRIFEFVIDNFVKEKSKIGLINFDDYKNVRWEDKIEMIKDVLPDIMVEHKHIYSILSKGIHELTEDECRESFDILKLCFEMILNKLIKDKEENNSLKKFYSEINKVYKKHSK